MKTFVCLLLCLSFSVGCRKDQEAEIFGDWETVSAVGFKWEYSIRRNGVICQSLQEYFPGTEFCHTFKKSSDTLFIANPALDVWVYKFEAEDVLTVRNISQSELFILRRK